MDGDDVLSLYEAPLLRLLQIHIQVVKGAHIKRNKQRGITL